MEGRKEEPAPTCPSSPGSSASRQHGPQWRQDGRGFSRVEGLRGPAAPVLSYTAVRYWRAHFSARLTLQTTLSAIKVLVWPLYAWFLHRSLSGSETEAEGSFRALKPSLLWFSRVSVCLGDLGQRHAHTQGWGPRRTTSWYVTLSVHDTDRHISGGSLQVRVGLCARKPGCALGPRHDPPPAVSGPFGAVSASCHFTAMGPNHRKVGPI